MTSVTARGNLIHRRKKLLVGETDNHFDELQQRNVSITGIGNRKALWKVCPYKS